MMFEYDEELERQQGGGEWCAMHVRLKRTTEKAWLVEQDRRDGTVSVWIPKSKASLVPCEEFPLLIEVIPDTYIVQARTDWLVGVKDELEWKYMTP